jgi:hypothetical protein
MNSKTFKLSAILFMCFFVVMLLSCEGGSKGTPTDSSKGSIGLNILFAHAGGASDTESRDEWPCDTTTVFICLFEEVQGLLECIEEDLEEITLDMPIDDPPDTIFAYFGDLPPGNYSVGIFCKHPTTGANLEKELITWYHGGIDSTGFELGRKNAEIIKIAKGNLNVTLKDVKITNYMGTP